MCGGACFNWAQLCGREGETASDPPNDSSNHARLIRTCSNPGSTFSCPRWVYGLITCPQAGLGTGSGLDSELGGPHAAAPAVPPSSSRERTRCQPASLPAHVRVTVGSTCTCTCNLPSAYHTVPRPTLEPTAASINRFLLLGPARNASFLSLLPRCSRQPDGVRDISLQKRLVSVCVRVTGTRVW